MTDTPPDVDHEQHDEDEYAKRIAAALLPLIQAQQQERKRWRTAIVWIEHIALFVLMIFAFQSSNASRTAADTTRDATKAAQEQAGDAQITGCLRLINAPVTEANARNVIANAKIQRLRLGVEVQLANSPDGTVDLNAAIAEALPILNELDGSAADYEAARAAYKTASEKSVKDPKGFLVDCREKGLISEVAPDSGD